MAEPPGDLGDRDARVEPQRGRSVSQVVRSPSERRCILLRAKSSLPSLAPGCSVVAVLRLSPDSVRNSRPSSAAPNRARCERSSSTNSGGMGTDRVSSWPRRLRPLRCRARPSSVHAFPERGSLVAKSIRPQPVSGRWQVARRRSRASEGRRPAKYMQPKNPTSRSPVRPCRPTAASSARTCSGLATTRRSTVAATSGAFHCTRSMGFAGSRPSSTA